MQQQWVYNSFQGGQIRYKANTNKCIDLAGGDNDNGTPLQIWVSGPDGDCDPR